MQGKVVWYGLFWTTNRSYKTTLRCVTTQKTANPFQMRRKPRITQSVWVFYWNNVTSYFYVNNVAWMRRRANYKNLTLLQYKIILNLNVCFYTFLLGNELYKFKTELINCKNKTITIVLNYLWSISIHQRAVTGGLRNTAVEKQVRFRNSMKCVPISCTVATDFICKTILP
jgi:hypothetical protein